MYHKGEITAQENAGEKTLGERNGRVVVNNIIPGAINFIEKQPFFIVSSKNSAGEITVSALAGEDGYSKVRNEKVIEIFPPLLFSNPHDKFWKNIAEHDKVGLLFIEPATRRRYRVNGSINFSGEKVILSVEQAYPNCPKYIQQRHGKFSGKPTYTPEKKTGVTLTEEVIGLVEQADTFFVGSSDLAGNMDVSHRGGPPGFIHVRDSSTLYIPDYRGNSMFNTLGNFVVNPEAALLFLDFEKKKSLQLSGTAEIIWNKADPEVNTGGTDRFWIFSIKRWTLSDNLKGMAWDFMSYSPFNP